MSRDLTFTLYKGKKHNIGKIQTRSWESWIRIFSFFEMRGSPQDTISKVDLDRAKDGPAIVLGEVRDGSKRERGSVSAIHAMALDLEDLPDDRIEAVFDALRPYEWCMWTTHKHGSVAAGGRARLRVVLPLATPIAPDQHLAAWTALDALVGSVNDKSTKDVCRLHYLPSTFDLSVVKSLSHHGRWIELEDLRLPDVVEPELQPELIDKIRRKGLYLRHKDPIKDLVDPLFEGVPFALVGYRHAAVLRLTLWLESISSELTPATLEHLFTPSLAQMQEEDGPTIKEIITAYDGAVNRSKARMCRGQAPYTEEDLIRIAAVHGWTPDQLDRRWIVMQGGYGWLLSESGAYVGPYAGDDLYVSLAHRLARAPVKLTERRAGHIHWLTPAELARAHGSIVDMITADLTIQMNSYDADTSTMREAACPLRKLDPHFDPSIDAWLKSMGGALYPKLVDWMACCSDLTKLLCAIYFEGPASCGKTLFAHGMAKLWTDGPPADIMALTGNFNAEITRCPLVLADEEIPRSYATTVTATLRSMLSTTTRPLTRKYRGPAALNGALRVILTANNEFLLESKDVSSSADLNAIAQRFLYVRVPHDTADMLAELPRETKEEWAHEGIARHALYLVENHKVEHPGKRFWVEGDISQMHRLLMTGSRWNSLVCEWLVRYLLDPKAFDTQRNGLIRRDAGQLLVNDRAISAGWQLYSNTKLEPETAKIGAALRAISGNKRQQLRFDGKPIRYRVIDLDHLLSWADRHNFGDRGTLLEAVGVLHPEPGANDPDECEIDDALEPLAPTPF